MKRLKRILLIAVIGTAGLVPAVPAFAEQNKLIPSPKRAPHNALCPNLYKRIITTWGRTQWRTVDYLLHRESRCDVTALNPKDTNGLPSYSLFQINAFWCQPSRYFKQGWLQHQGILSSCDELFDVDVPFRSARAIYDYAVDNHGFGWTPWNIYKTK